MPCWAGVCPLHIYCMAYIVIAYILIAYIVMAGVCPLRIYCNAQCKSNTCLTHDERVGETLRDLCLGSASDIRSRLRSGT